MTLLEAERRKCDFLERWAPPNARVVWGRAEEQELEAYGVAVAKALAQPPVAVEWCLPLVRQGGAAVLWLGPTAPTWNGSRPSPRGSAAALPEARTTVSSSCASSRPTPPGFPRRAGVARKRPLACRSAVATMAALAWARSTRSRTRRAASARRPPPSISPRASQRQAAGARRRPRSAGERDLGARYARQRHVELRPARRRAARRARGAHAVREPRPRSGEAGARGRRGRARPARATASDTSRRRSPRARRSTTSSSSTARPRSAR